MSRFSSMNASQLNDWYERVVGYRPQVDSPIMSDQELRALCEGMHKEALEMVYVSGPNWQAAQLPKGWYIGVQCEIDGIRAFDLDSLQGPYEKEEFAAIDLRSMAFK